MKFNLEALIQDMRDVESSDEEDTVDNEIVDKFIRTFHSGNYDVEFDGALKSVIIEPVRPTQTSYTKPDNWREMNRIGIEWVKGQLQTCISSVINHHIVNLDLNNMDNEIPIVWHEPILDEYWDQLEAEIDQVNQLDSAITDIQLIRIVNVEMTKECLAALVAICRSGSVNNSFKFVNFNNANLCGEGIVWLSKLVDVSSQLQRVHLFHNRIDNMESACCLSRSLKSHACIDELHLTHCDLGSNPKILLILLQSDVSSIDLNNNNIDSLGALKIAEYLESDPPVHQINLDHNLLNDDDVILISQALRRNMTLKRLDLDGNNFTSFGAKALLTCVFDGSSLNAISESNHTLIEMNMFYIQDRRHFNLAGCIDRLLRLDCTQKIILALQDKDSLLQYLANVPVGLIPEVMVFPLRRVVNSFFFILYTSLVTGLLMIYVKKVI